jgi:outer membrane protein OmpA-like peptidoglycan-associated protein
MSTAFRVGIFIVLALGALCAGVFLIGNNTMLFGRTYSLQTDFPNVESLNPGADVRVGGIHEGTVKKIDLPSRPGGRVTVLMSLRDSTRNNIRKDSVASIKTQGLMGDQFVEISFGLAKAPDVQNGDMIASAAPEDMSKQAQVIANEAQQGVTAFRDDMKAVQQNFLLRGFFDKRGYTDTSELTQHAIPSLPSGSPANEFEYDEKRLFDKPDNAKLKNKKMLNAAGRYLQQNEFGLAVVTSAETLGDADKDRLLSEARAKVVSDYLVQNFKIDDAHLKTFGRGKVAGGDLSQLSIVVYPGKQTARDDQSASPSNAQLKTSRN